MSETNNKEAHEYLEFRKRREIREIFGDLVIAVAASAPMERDTPFRDTVLKLVAERIWLARLLSWP